MRNTIEKKLVFGLVQAMILLSSQMVDATVHIHPNLYCENATKVSYKDAFCQDEINYQLNSLILSNFVLVAVVIALAGIGVAKGCEHMRDQCSKTPFPSQGNLAQRDSRWLFWRRENPQDVRLPVANDGYGTIADTVEELGAASSQAA